jgi:hypothetical protein
MKCLKCLDNVNHRHAKRDGKWQDVFECETCGEVEKISIHNSDMNLKGFCGVPYSIKAQVGEKLSGKLNANAARILRETGDRIRPDFEFEIVQD